MKLITFSSIALLSIFAACTNQPAKEQTSQKTDSAAATAQQTKEVSPADASMNKVVNAYLQIKDALAQDNDQQAASAAQEMTKVLAAFDKGSLPADKAKVFTDMEDDIKEHAEHIGKTAGNIKHQREHFESLSKDIYDLVKGAGSAGQTLYVDHCPMYNNNKGANWLSQTKEIQNPYLGKGMSTCGIVQEELK